MTEVNICQTMQQNSKINEETKTICAINRETVHKICSGQVVFSLAIAVKELLENAIDAGATNIEIRLKEYGSESLEVSDNGSGVEEKYFAALTLKHFTSKLREFADLGSISTLGFRGEALSSLCALSNLSITTRYKSVEYGTKMVYDSNGHIKNQSKCARQVGTTVSLTDLFASLPVRHKEFNKNLKREFSKMCNLLYAYCLVTKGVRISCTNQTKKGVRTTVVATQGGRTVQENIICVFGIKQLETLIEIQMKNPEEKYLEDYGIKKPPNSDLPFTLEGYISKCTHGSGRSAADRQYFYVNSRPCEPNKIAKLTNEIYKYFNGAQYPFVFLNIKTLQSQIDVNVTPDKRQIFLEQEKLLLATLKTTLLDLFKSFPSTLKVQNLNIKLSKETEEKKLSQTLKNWVKNKEKYLDNRGTKRELSGTMSFIRGKRVKIENDFSQDLSCNSSSEDEESQIEKFVKESYNSSDSEADLSIVSVVKPKRNYIQKTILDQELRNSLKEFKSDYNSLKTSKNNLNPEIVEKNLIENEVEVNKMNKNNCYKITFENSDAKTVDYTEVNKIAENNCKIKFANPFAESIDKTGFNKTNDCHKITFENSDAKTVDYTEMNKINENNCKITFENPLVETIDKTGYNKTNDGLKLTFENSNAKTVDAMQHSKTVDEYFENVKIDEKQYNITNENGCYKISFENPLVESIRKRNEANDCHKMTIENRHVKTTDAMEQIKTVDEYFENVIDETIDETRYNKTNENDCYKITFENADAKTIKLPENKHNKSSEKSEIIINNKFENENNRRICKTSDNETKINKQIVIKSEDISDIINESYFAQPSTSKSNFGINSKNNAKFELKMNSSNISNYLTSQNSTVNVDLPNLETLINKISFSQSENSALNQVKFKSELTSKNAETELQRHISKDMFKKMDIIGQFNKGFIITKLDSDLFIIDQHATDEKYNFETLQKTTVIQNQRLVVPKPLDLTAANELLLIDNLEVFTKNGFTFEIDENAEARNKVKLTAMPVSKNWEFGKEAIDELLFMLQEDGATENIRPSGIQAMFASRACRKSVMVGSSLSNSDMRRLVNHMGEINQPWNCPHGRPTMRHLINLDLLKTEDSSSEEEEEEDE